MDSAGDLIVVDHNLEIEKAGSEDLPVLEEPIMAIEMEQAAVVIKEMITITTEETREETKEESNKAEITETTTETIREEDDN